MSRWSTSGLKENYSNNLNQNINNNINNNQYKTWTDHPYRTLSSYSSSSFSSQQQQQQQQQQKYKSLPRALQPKKFSSEKESWKRRSYDLTGTSYLDRYTLKPYRTHSKPQIFENCYNFNGNFPRSNSKDFTDFNKSPEFAFPVRETTFSKLFKEFVGDDDYSADAKLRKETKNSDNLKPTQQQQETKIKVKNDENSVYQTDDQKLFPTFFPTFRHKSSNGLPCTGVPIHLETSTHSLPESFPKVVTDSLHPTILNAFNKTQEDFIPIFDFYSSTKSTNSNQNNSNDATSSKQWTTQNEKDGEDLSRSFETFNCNDDHHSSTFIDSRNSNNNNINNNNISKLREHSHVINNHPTNYYISSDDVLLRNPQQTSKNYLNDFKHHRTSLNEEIFRKHAREANSMKADCGKNYEAHNIFKLYDKSLYFNNNPYVLKSGNVWTIRVIPYSSSLTATELCGLASGEHDLMEKIVLESKEQQQFNQQRPQRNNYQEMLQQPHPQNYQQHSLMQKNQQPPQQYKQQQQHQQQQHQQQHQQQQQQQQPQQLQQQQKHQQPSCQQPAQRQLPDLPSLPPETQPMKVERGEILLVKIVKTELGGLGFSIGGGRLPNGGGGPIFVRRIFDTESSRIRTNNLIQPGDEVLTIDGWSTAGMSQYEVWNKMKELKDGPTNLLIQRKLYLSETIV